MWYVYDYICGEVSCLLIIKTSVSRDTYVYCSTSFNFCEMCAWTQEGLNSLVSLKFAKSAPNFFGLCCSFWSFFWIHSYISPLTLGVRAAYQDFPVLLWSNSAYIRDYLSGLLLTS